MEIKVKIKIKDVEIDVDQKDLKELYEFLDSMFGSKKTAWIPYYPDPCPWVPWPSPWYTTTADGTMTWANDCGSLCSRF